MKKLLVAIFALMLSLTSCNLNNNIENSETVEIGDVITFKILTGAMEPTLQIGKKYEFVVIDINEYKVDDIVLAIDENGNKIVSRIVSITENSEFILKGDANAVAYSEKFSKEQILGRLK